jgi:hypothetical protein
VGEGTFARDNLRPLIDAAGLPKYASKLEGIGVETADKNGRPIPAGQSEARETMEAWITSAYDGNFEANVKLQFTTDGTTWTDSGWTISPTYPNDQNASGKTYTFSGTA